MPININIPDNDLRNIVRAEAKRVVVQLIARLLLERASVQAHATESRGRMVVRSLARQMLQARLEHSLTTETSRSVAFAQRIPGASGPVLDQVGSAIGRARRGNEIPPAPVDPDNPTEAENAATVAANERYREALVEANELEAQPHRAELGDDVEAAVDALLARGTGKLKDAIDAVIADIEDQTDIEPADLLRRQG